MTDSDIDLTAVFAEKIRDAGARKIAVCPRGGGTKAFLGRSVQAEAIDLSAHRGVISYEPTELVITVRCGTPLDEVRRLLAEAGQMVAFEPPAFGVGATIGGTIACGLSGPARPYRGSARDFVLGVTCINGLGERLRFGGQVMKNVAGYDVSRLMTGAYGTLGLLLDVSLKVLPSPEHEITLCFETDGAGAIERFTEWSGQPLPISGTYFYDGDCRVRLSGSGPGVEAAARVLGGDTLGGEEATAFWRDLAEQKLAFFTTPGNLWRVSVPPGTKFPEPGQNWLIEWGGAQRWYKSSDETEALFDDAAGWGGHATLFRGPPERASVFQPLDPVKTVLHRRLKDAFDPERILNPGFMYEDL